MATDRYAVIVAGGRGSRFGSDVPKQYCALEGRPVMVHTIEAFREVYTDVKVVVVVAQEMLPLWRDMAREYGLEDVLTVEGGDTRWASVKNAVEALKDAAPDSIVMIHDAARPLVDSDTIRRVASACVNTDGAIPVVEVTDSLRVLEERENPYVTKPVDRALYRAVQTPQASRLWRLRQAYAEPYSPEMTDDASVLAAAGFDNIIAVKGSTRNIKITNPDDLLVAEALLRATRKR